MCVSKRSFSWSLVLSLLILFQLLKAVTFASDKGQSEKIKKKVIEYLNNNKELQERYFCRFDGGFRSFPIDLESELKKYFPTLKFIIARVKISPDLPPSKQSITLIIDSDTNKVIAHIWGAYWALRASSTFKDILLRQKVASEEEAVKAVKSLAELFIYGVEPPILLNDSVGKAYIQDKTVKVELVRGESAFLLQVKLDKKIRFGKLYVTFPNGQKLPNFD